MLECANGLRSGVISRREGERVSPFLRFDRYRNVLLRRSAERNCARGDRAGCPYRRRGNAAAQDQGRALVPPLYRMNTIRVSNTSFLGTLKTKNFLASFRRN